MAPVTQYVSVYRDGKMYNSDLYRRVIEMAFLPAIDDQVFIWPGQDEDDGDCRRVTRRYFTNDGRACIELVGIMIDPPAGWSSARLAYPHFTRNDGGDPVALLLAAGWTEA
jgi:hypothetical protein